MTKATEKKPSTNGWTAENTELAVQLYRDSLAADPDNANSAENLAAIQEATGAKSISAVRSKLTSEKVYVKPDQPRKVGGGSALRKIHFVRALAAAALKADLVESSDELDSLESAKMSTLKTIAKLAGVTVVGD